MSTDLLSILKPLVFEGKTGILRVSHAYNDEAQFYLKEGIIEQVTTTKLQGAKAAKLASKWVSITTTFLEDELGNYTPTQEIGTAAILALLEKKSKNIPVIRKKIPDNSAILEIHSDKLNTVETLGTEDLKVAVLFNGTRSIEEAMKISGKSELTFLTYACRLIMAGVAKTKDSNKETMKEEERILFLHSLKETLTQLIGLAAPILINDAFAEINAQPDTLSTDEIPHLLTAIRKTLDDKEQEVLDEWEKAYLGTARE